MDWRWLAWVAVAALGGVVGASELISRYKDDPWPAVIRSWWAMVYIAINSLASAGAFGLIRANGWFGPSLWAQILMAGVSAMAFFRTSLFVVRAGDRDVGVGPSGFLQIFLSAADRYVDRARAAARSEAVAEVMRHVDQAKARSTLPPYCITLMQNVPQEEQQRLERLLEGSDKRDFKPSVKALLLGLELMNVVGVDVLTTAVKSLGDEIRSSPAA